MNWPLSVFLMMNFIFWGLVWGAAGTMEMTFGNSLVPENQEDDLMKIITACGRMKWMGMIMSPTSLLLFFLV